MKKRRRRRKNRKGREESPLMGAKRNRMEKNIIKNTKKRSRKGKREHGK